MNKYLHGAQVEKSRPRIGIIADEAALSRKCDSEGKCIFNFEHDAYTASLFSPAGAWPCYCDAVHIVSISDSAALRACIETAWRSELPVILGSPLMLFPEFSGIGSDSTSWIIPDQWQDALDRASCLLFVTLEESQRFKALGFTAPNILVLEELANKNGGQIPSDFLQESWFNSEIAVLVYLALVREGKMARQILHTEEAAEEIYVDVSHAASEAYMSGIIRTELEYAAQLHKHFGKRVQYVAYGQEENCYLEVPASQFLTHVQLVQENKFHNFGSLQPTSIKPGSTLVIFNYLWAMHGLAYINFLAALSHGSSIRIFHFLYDFYYRKFPFWQKCFAPKSPDDLLALSRAISCFLTDSRASGKDISEYIFNRRYSIPPIIPLRLGDSTDANCPAGCLPRVLADLLKGAPFILMVSAFFYNKNHLLMYNIYSRLLRDYPGERIPHLVCVGKKFDDNLAHDVLCQDDFIKTHVHIMDSLSEAEMHALYEECLFTVYPSLYEGFGLPVSESLAYGKVCVASSSSSMPEVAPGYADLLDPYDFRAWYDRLRLYMFNPDRLKQREEEIRDYRKISWADSGRQLSHAISGSPGRLPQPPILSLDSVFNFTDFGAMAPWFGLPGEGCRIINGLGISLSGTPSCLQFRLRTAPGPVCLILVCEMEDDGTAVDIFLNGQSFLRRSIAKGQNTICLILPDAAQESRNFRTVRLQIVNMAAPIVHWQKSMESGKVLLKSLGLRLANIQEENNLALLGALDDVVEDGAAIFRGLLLSRPELASLAPDAAGGALRLLLWAWQYGIYEDTLISGYYSNFRKALQALDRLPAPGSLIDGYSGLVHAIWLSRPDLEAIFDVSQAEGQKGLVEWFDRNGRTEYHLNSRDCLKTIPELRNQITCSRNRLRETVKNYLPEISGKWLISHDQLRKYFGYNFPGAFTGSRPTLTAITSQLPTYNQFLEPIYGLRCAEMGQKVILHRKQWEFVYILQALLASGLIRPGARGVGFGCGTEPLPAIFAKRGCRITASDYPDETAWKASGQQSLDLRDLWKPDIISWEEFAAKVEFVPVDMNKIPKHFLASYDFTWSACALEHLGSLRHGIEFVRNSSNYSVYPNFAIYLRSNG